MAGRDITESIVGTVSARGNASALWSNTSTFYDYAIGGLPFLSAASKDHPYERGTAPYRKDQVDTSNEPGEQSLSGLWLRSQSSMHLGAGLKYLDPALTGDDGKFRAREIVGLDVWTKGKVTLAPRAEQIHVSASGAPRILGYALSSGEYGVMVAEGASLTFTDSANTDTVVTHGAGSVAAFATDGSYYYIANGTQIWRGSVTTKGVASLLWTVSNVVVMGWVKQRLVVACSDGKVYDLGTGTAPTAPAAMITHPLGGSWVWTDITETSDGILLSGYSGDQGAIYGMYLDTSGATPVLDVPVPVVRLPRGERAHAVYGYLGSYVLVGTTRGIRVGIDQGGGKVVLGPISVETVRPVRDFDGWDSYVYATCSYGANGSGSGVYRLGLADLMEDGRVPWVQELSTEAGDTADVYWVTVSQGVAYFSMYNSGVWRSHATEKRATGWVETGLIRFNTAEQKSWLSCQVNLRAPWGSVAIFQVDPVGNEVFLFSTPLEDSDDVSTSAGEPRLATERGFRFELRRSTLDATKGPEMAGYVVRAVPAGARQRLISVPLMCFEEEKDRKGLRVNRAPWPRLQALEAVEGTGEVVSFQDLQSGEQLLGTIEQVQFSSGTRPAGSAGKGGIVTVVLKTVA